jgi:hypothetical protein
MNDFPMPEDPPVTTTAAKLSSAGEAVSAGMQAESGSQFLGHNPKETHDHEQ